MGRRGRGYEQPGNVETWTLGNKASGPSGNYLSASEG
jgi:hypothetical protein